MRTCSPRRQHGFSLVEMLVVLLIAGMALTLTAQAVGQYQRAQASASGVERAGRQYRLSEAWFRDAVRGLVAIAEPQWEAAGGRLSPDVVAPQFRGNAMGFSGTTLLPVLAGQGVPTTQEWTVVAGSAGTDVLRLREEGEELLLSFPGRGDLRLHYLDTEGGVHAEWPPTNDPWPQLPAAIILEIGADPDGMPATTVISAIAGIHVPLELPYEEEPF